MENNKNQLKQRIDDAIRKMVSIPSVRDILLVKKKISIDLDKINIVKHEKKHDKYPNNNYFLKLIMDDNQNINYSLEADLSPDGIAHVFKIISNGELTDNYQDYINIIYSLILYFSDDGNNDNIIHLIQSC